MMNETNIRPPEPTPKQPPIQEQIVPPNKPRYHKKVTILLVIAVGLTGLVIATWKYIVPQMPAIEKSPPTTLPTETPTTSQPTGPEINTITEKKLAIILTSNTDRPEQIGPEFLQQQVFESPFGLTAFYKEASYGKVVFTGKVFGTFVIPDQQPCDISLLEQQMRAIPQQNNVDISTYDYVSYYHIGPVSCAPREGHAEVPGRFTFMFTSNNDITALAHEIGHNLGLYHAQSYECTNEQGKQVPLSNQCNITDYGDGFDIMGSQLYHPNIYTKLLLGWVNASQVPTVTASGTYNIEPLEKPTTGVLGIKILKKQKYYQGKFDQYYYVEFRQPFGFDRFEPQSPVVCGVLVHVASDPQFSNGSYLLHMNNPTPQDSNVSLQKGQSFTDPEIGMSLTVNDITPQTATVSIKFTN